MLAGKKQWRTTLFVPKHMDSCASSTGKESHGMSLGVQGKPQIQGRICIFLTLEVIK